MRASTANEWRQGWKTLLSAFFCYGVGSVYTGMLTLFISPLANEFGWSRTVITAGLLGVAVICLFAMPFVGMLVDRWGSKRVGLPGMVIYCSGIALLGTTSGSVLHWWALWLVVSVGVMLVHIMVWVAAVGRMFDKARGKAMAVMMCGNGAIQAVYPILLNWVIENHGWRAGFFSFGAAGALLALPLLIFLFSEGDQRVASTQVATPPLTGMAPRDAFRSWTFYRIALVTLLMTSSIIALAVHFMPIMTGLGIDRSRVAEALPLIGIGAIIGRLGTGALLDRFHGALIGAGGCLVPTMAVATILFVGVDDGMIYVVATLLGLGLGIEIDIVAYVSTRYFGLKHYGTIFGAIGGVMTFASGAGPMIGGAMYDLSGSYTILLIGTFGAFLTCAVLVGSLGRYPVFELADGDGKADTDAASTALGVELANSLNAKPT